MKNIENVVVCGDIHGEYTHFYKYQRKHDLINTVFIFAGDFGIGFDLNIKKEFRRLNLINNSLIKRNNYMLVVRGNHDNPYYYNNETILNQISNIKLLKDYTVLNILDNNFLFVGGATSVDRKPNGRYLGRKVDVNYWLDEKFILDENLLIKAINNIDINYVVTHSTPDFAYPQTYAGASDWFRTDPSLIEELIVERRLHTELYNIVLNNNQDSKSLKGWFYGHYHDNHQMYFNDTKFQLLDKNSFNYIFI